jgi:hypothetical protein
VPFNQTRKECDSSASRLERAVGANLDLKVQSRIVATVTDRHNHPVKALPLTLSSPDLFSAKPNGHAI